MEGGSTGRGGSIRIQTQPATGTGGAVYYAPIGLKSYFTRVGVAGATPVITPDGLVLIPRDDNSMLAFVLPDSLPNTGGGWPSAWTFTASKTTGTGETVPPPTSAVVSTDGVAYFLVTEKGLVWALDTTKPTPTQPFEWSPLDLGLPPWGHPANNNDPNNTIPAIFQSWTTGSAILLHSDYVWIPAPDYHLGAVFNRTTGVGSVTSFSNTTQLAKRLQGSVGEAITDDGHAAAFTEHGNTGVHGLRGFRHDARQMWQTYEDLLVARNEFSHPVSLTFTSTAGDQYACIFATSHDLYGVHITATGNHPSTHRGQACGYGSGAHWPNEGYILRTASIAMPSWVSAPATLPVVDGWRLFFNVVIPNDDLAGGQRCAVMAVDVDLVGVVPTDSGSLVAEVFILRRTHCNSAPVVMRNAFPDGAAAVVVMQAHGVVNVFKWDTIAAGPLWTYDAAAGMPPLSSPDSVWRFMGNYIAGTFWEGVGRRFPM